MSIFLLAVWLLGALILLALGFVNANHEEFKAGSAPTAALAYIFWPVSLLLVALYAVYDGVFGAQGGTGGQNTGNE